MPRHPSARGLALVGLTVSLVACNLAQVTPSGPTSAPETGPAPTFAASPTSTPTPYLLLLTGPTETPLEDALGAWADSQAWQLRSLPAGEFDASILNESDGPRAIIGYRTGIGTELSACASSQRPVVLVEEQGVQPGAYLSTVGGAGSRSDQAAFLAGALAGLAGTVDAVGIVTQTGGDREDVYRMGFAHGVRYGCPRCSLAEVVADNLGGDSLAAGVQAVFVIPGPEADSALRLVLSSGRWAVWIGDWPAGLDRARLAARVSFNPEGLAAQALEALLGGEPGSAWPYTVENGGIRVMDVNPGAISPGKERLAVEAYQAVAAGELDPGVDPETGAER